MSRNNAKKRIREELEDEKTDGTEWHEGERTGERDDDMRASSKGNAEEDKKSTIEKDVEEKDRKHEEDGDKGSVKDNGNKRSMALEVVETKDTAVPVLEPSVSSSSSQPATTVERLSSVWTMDGPLNVRTSLKQRHH